MKRNGSEAEIHDSSSSKRYRSFVDAGMARQLSELLRCPGCKTMTKQPIFLPNCGHCLCVKCAESLAKTADDKTAITCPGCQTPNATLNSNSKEISEKTVTEKILEMLSKFEKPALDPVLGMGCPHVNVAGDLTECQHCDVKFCSACLVSHIDLLKLETSWIASDFKGRHSKALENLDKAVAVARNKITENVEAMQLEISVAMEKLAEELKTAVLARRDVLLASVRNHGQNQLNEINVFNADTVLDAEVRKLMCSVGRIASSSSLFCPLESVLALRKEVCTMDQNIQELEEISRGVIPSRIVLSPVDPQVLETVASSISQLHDVSMEYGPKKIDKAPFEVSTHLKALGEGRLADVRATFGRRNLSQDCKRYIAHYACTYLHPVLDAIFCGSLEMVKFFVEEQNADIQWTVPVTTKRESEEFQYIGNCAHLAAWLGKLDILKYFLNLDKMAMIHNGNQLPRVTDGSLLHWAALGNKLAVIDFAINELKLPIDDVRNDNFRVTPLGTAVLHGKLEAVNFLMEKGANVRLLVGGNSTLHLAIKGGRENIVRRILHKAPDLALQPDPSSEYPLLFAVEQNNVDIVRCLLALPGIKVDYWCQIAFKTPLLAAVANKNLEMIQLLHQHSARLELADGDGHTALYYAVANNCPDIVEFLLSNSSEAKEWTKDNSALGLALTCKSWDVMPLLSAAVEPP